jgi:hypothetical protein
VKACKHSVVERASVSLTPILGRLLYAYRECRWICEEAQTVTILGPALQQIATTATGGAPESTSLPFGKVTFDMQPGAGSSLVAAIAPRALEAWFGRKRPSWATGERPVKVGVDIAQSVADREPVAVAYLATPKPPVPRED